MRPAILIAVMVLSLIVTSTGRARADSTAPSDALLADYSALVQQHERRVFLPIGELSAWESARYNPAVLSQEQLQTLEPEHGGEARYWELRYWCLQAAMLTRRGAYGLDSSWAAQEDESLAIDLLVRARDCGGASPFALYSLARIQRAQRRREIDVISADLALDDARRREALIYAMVADEEEFARALERINSAWPDEAWPKWWHADELFNLGEIEQACDWLEEGNAATSCSYPACWPETFIRESVAKGAAPGGEVLCGAVLMASQSRLLPIAVRWKEHAKEAELVFNLAGERRAFNALSGFACRQAGTVGSGSMDTILAMVVPNMFAGRLLRSHAEELSQTQVNALLDLQREVDQIQSRLRGLSRDSELFNESLFGAIYTELNPVNYRCESDLDDAREYLRLTYRLLPQRRYRAYHAYIAQELRTVQKELAPRLAVLGSFDFSAPASFEHWNTY
ncbi:hypothetical protein IT575_11660 [bacterium]|nr:hypothetical protein [bacterium]